MRELLSLCPSSFSVTDACLLCTTIAQPLYWNNGEDEALLLVPTTVGNKIMTIKPFLVIIILQTEVDCCEMAKSMHVLT